jgi:polygalacturonase
VYVEPDGAADGTTQSDSSTADSGDDTTPPGNADAGHPSCDSLPSEPTIPPACATLTATQAVTAGVLPSESTLDTGTIQTALNACAAGQAVQLTTDGANNAFVTGPLSLPSGVTLWVDAGVTLYGSRNPAVYGPTCAAASGGTCSPLISVKSANAGIVGKGTIDGQGGEPIMGMTQSWWDLTGSTGGNSANPALITALGTKNFVLYQITLHNSPKFHVKLDGDHFIVWGITIKTPSAAVNSQGTPLTPAGAHNTDGVDPGEAASNGYIVYNDISDGDDQIAIKGSSYARDIVIAHNHFLAGHGMSIGSETNGGVSNIQVCDLSIDGTMIADAGSSAGIRIKSNPGVGGPVTNVTYDDVCVRGIKNPILLTPFYATGTGSIPVYTGITIHDFHDLDTTSGTVTIYGYDSDHVTQLSLDNVVFDAPPTVKAQFANVTLGPGQVSFIPTGNGVTDEGALPDADVPEGDVPDSGPDGDVPYSGLPDAGPANPCTGKWVDF